ncbi:ARM repeat-containing protein [Xylaria palmicola]|nr:ARM repeat-containing protein [Xylaria palmicola]
MGSEGQLPSSQQTTGVHLCQVYPSSESDTVTNVDIIALHGLDTDSSRTWTWKHEGSEEPGVNWLKHPDMLPHRIPNARIFTCDWPSSVFKDKSTIQMTAVELARCLLLSIRSQFDAGPTRPILFIASCLGGIILTQAMVIAAEPGSEYNSLWEATRGIVFLATPFRGTAFQDITMIAVPYLQLQAHLTNATVTNLLDSVKESNHFLLELVGAFTRICRPRLEARSCHLAIFYETKKGNLLRKGLSRLVADALSDPKPLVDSGSARLDIVPNPIALDRTHVMMNKFSSPNDRDFDAVSGQINIMLSNILGSQPIEKAKLWIVHEHYKRRLDIERLSGDLLPLNQCYINLAIVEQSSEKDKLNERGERTQESSPFSLSARLKVEMPYNGKAIALPALFGPRETPNGYISPRRIMIRGRAGVGKTTLCKKIVYEVLHNNLWQNRFDFVLWVPLRHLKHPERRQTPGYNLRHLFRQEFFSQSMECNELAEALWRAMNAKDVRILFILDGLDEVWSQLDGSIREFLHALLNQPDVIITSRPNVAFAANTILPYLELETIGFYPDQVGAYVENSFTDLQTGKTDWETVEAVRTFLHSHQLLRTLVRIPIQLDAFCFTWNNSRDIQSSNGDSQETMTAIYQRIEQSLWRKDAERLEKLTQPEMLNARNGDISRLLDGERRLLECLAFNGLCSDIIEFEPTHREFIQESVSWEPMPSNKMLFDDVLGRVSFLRPSDPSSNARDRHYHFLHLTYQEYFGARYFVRKWKARERLECLSLSRGDSEMISPAEFVHRHKYNARYAIFWRFVAGLLSDDMKESTCFFQTIEAEPRDLLGPAHQRLVMHCMSELSQDIPLREYLEDQLIQCILFECERRKTSKLAGEMEIRSEILETLVRQAPEKKISILRSLDCRQVHFQKFLQTLAEYLLEDRNAVVRREALELIRGLPMAEKHLPAILKCLGDEDDTVRMSALDLISSQPAAEKLPAIIAGLNDEDRFVRAMALEVLGSQPAAGKYLPAIVARLGDEDRDVRSVALRTLASQPAAANCIPAIIACLKDEDYDVRSIALRTLGRQPVAEEHIPAIPVAEKYLPAITACLVDENPGQPNISEPTFRNIAARLNSDDAGVRKEAVRALRGPNLPEELLQAVATRVKDEDSYVKDEAIIPTIMTYLESGDVDTRKAALKAVAAYLKDGDSQVRRAAVQVLQIQLNLSEEVLRNITALLDDKDQWVKAKAMDTLISRGALAFIPNRHVEFLYENLIFRSFLGHVAWQVVGGTSRLTLGDRVYSMERPARFASAVRSAQRKCGIPSHQPTWPHSIKIAARRLFGHD